MRKTPEWLLLEEIDRTARFTVVVLLDLGDVLLHELLLIPLLWYSLSVRVLAALARGLRAWAARL